MYLVTRLAFGENRDALVGDLLEQYGRGRSRIWFWRQTVAAILLSFVAEVSSHRYVALSVVVVDQMLPLLYTRWLVHWLARVHSAWYPNTWNWLAAAAPDPVWTLAVWLEPWNFTWAVVWCGMWAGAARLIALTQPSARRLTAALFILLGVVRYGPLLVFDPVGASHFVWYATFEFVIIPLCILFGAGAFRPNTREVR
jgi:hypothetical protein